MRVNTVSHLFVEFIPERLEDGTLYISETYDMAAHRCCCGCGEEVITPLYPTDWSLTFQDSQVSLSPSIGNWSFACRSHYWIRNGRVVWAGDMSDEAIQSGREMDKLLKDRYFNDIRQQKTTSRWSVLKMKVRGLVNVVLERWRRK